MDWRLACSCGQFSACIFSWYANRWCRYFVKAGHFSWYANRWGRMCCHISHHWIIRAVWFFLLGKHILFFLFWQFARRRFWLHVMTYEQRPERPAQLTLRSAALQRFPLPHPGPPPWFPFENVHAPVMLSIQCRPLILVVSCCLPANLQTSCLVV